MNTRSAAVLVILVTLAALWPLTRCEFTTWDDPANTYENPFVLNPSLDSLKYHWSRQTGDLYIPVTYTAWVGLGAIARVDNGRVDNRGAIELNPWIFHTANLLVHMLSALLVLSILRRLGFETLPACIAAIVFAIHPVQVEAVGWISGLKDVLAGMFCLMAIDRYLAPRSRWSYALALLAFVAALLSKPQAVALPVILVVIDFMIRGRGWKQIARSTWPFFIFAIPIALLGRHLQPGWSVPHVPLWQRPIVALDAIAFYLWKVVYPMKLGIDYGRTPQWIMQTGVGYIASITMILFTAALLLWRRADRAVAGLCIFIVAVLPVLGFLPFEFQEKSTVADHYLYLSMFGLAVVSAALLGKIKDRRVTIAVSSFVVLLLGARSVFACFTWKDSETLYQHAIHVNPDSITAHNNLLVVALDDSNAQLAEHEAQWIVQRKPDDMNAQLTLGRAMAVAKRFDEAEKIFRAACERWPDSPVPHLSLAAVLLDQHRPAEALRQYDIAEQIDPHTVNLSELRARANEMLAREKSSTKP